MRHIKNLIVYLESDLTNKINAEVQIFLHYSYVDTFEKIVNLIFDNLRVTWLWITSTNQDYYTDVVKNRILE